MLLLRETDTCSGEATVKIGSEPLLMGKIYSMGQLSTYYTCPKI